MSGTSINLTPVFVPTQISGCQLWLDAGNPTSYTISGSTLTSIRDNSSTKKTITINSAPSVSPTTFNTRPGFVFSSGNRLSAPITALGQNMTLVAVYRVSANTTSVPLSIGISNSGANETGIGFNSGSSYYNIYDFGFAETGNSTVSTWDVNLLHIGVKSSSAPNLISVVNGTTSGSASSAYSNSNTQINLGGGGFAFAGVLAEAIVYSVAISTSQRQELEGYLAWKWGLQGNLPSNHPYKLSPFLGVSIAPVPVSPPLVYNNNLFLPTQFSGCALWLDARDTSSMTFSSGKISQWNDKSGNSRNVSQASAGARPPLSNDGVYFNYGALVHNGSLGMNGVFTGYVVNRAIDTATFQRAIDVEDSNGNVIMIDNTQISIMNNGTGFGTSFNAFLNQTMMFGWNMNVSSAQYGINGSNFVTLPSGYQRSNSGTSITIGNAVGGTGVGGFRGFIYEIIFYTTLLNTSQRQQIEGYLAWKWGIQGSMPSTQPYKAPLLLKSTVWLPTRISGCQLWLDAKDSTTLFTDTTATRTASLGNTVARWNDKSGNGNYLYQNTAGSRPILSKIPNGLPGVYFATSPIQLITINNNATTGNTSRTIFLLQQAPNTSSQTRVGTGGHGGATPPSAFGFDNSPPTAVALLWTPYVYTAADVTRVIQLRTFSLLYAYYDSGLSQIGGGYDFGNVLSKSTTLNTTANTWYFGLRPDNAGSVDSFVCEFIHYNKMLNAAEVSQVEGYLAWKWGLVGNLPGNHPYKLFPPSP
jgi:hypothetical protein